MQDFLLTYWQYIAIAVCVVGFLGYDKVVGLVGKFKLPTISTPVKTPVAKPVNEETVEYEDVRAIAHLRDRAVQVKDKDLLLEIKNVSGKFFDLHSVIVDDNKS